MILKFSKQLSHERNCGQHCISMITGLPIEFICSQMKKWNCTHILDVRDAMWRFGYECEMREKYVGQKLPDLCILDLSVPRKFIGEKIVSRNGHWAVYFRGQIWDSCIGIHEWNDYLEIYRSNLRGFLKVHI